MKLYYTAGTCSMGIRIILEEIGAPFEAQPVNLRASEQSQPAYLAVNPKAKVPTLVRDDGSVLTEFGAIAWWLALANPEARLLPADAEGQARVLEATDYCVGTIHMQAFARILRPGRSTPNAADEDAVKAQGREMAARGFELMDRALHGREWVAGEYSIADAALFYVEHWAGRTGVALPPNCAAHFSRMRDRPAVQRTLAAEGLA